MKYLGVLILFKVYFIERIKQYVNIQYCIKFSQVISFFFQIYLLFFFLYQIINIIMNRFLIVFLLQIAYSYKHLLHIVLLNTCIRCVKLDKNSVLYTPDLYYHLDQTFNSWDPTQSLTIGQKYQLQFSNTYTLSKRFLLEYNDNWTVLIQNDYESLQSNDFRSVALSVRRSIGNRLSQNLVLYYLYNETLFDNDQINNYKTTFANLSDKSVIFYQMKQFQANKNEILQKFIQDYVSSHPVPPKENDQELILKNKILKMCQNQIRRLLLQEYAMALNHKGKPYYKQLIRAIQQKILPECQKQESYKLTLLTLFIIIMLIVVDVIIQIRNKKKQGVI